jgi:PAS domain S-box-containing protein
MYNTAPDTFEDLFSHLPVAVYRTTPGGRIVAANAAFAELLGAERVEDLGDVDVRSLYVDAGVRPSMMERARGGASIAPEEIRIRRLDGRVIWVRISSRGVLGADGDIEYYEGVAEDVSERRAVNAELRRKNLLLDALTEMQNRYIAGVDPGVLFDRLLEDLLRTTRSEYGFIAQVLHDENGRPFLRSYAMSNIAWNEATRKLFAEHGPRGMEFHNLETLFGRVVTGKTAIVSNDPRQDPRGSGRPEGHPPLDSFLGVPIPRGDDVLGMIALANRPGGYLEDMVDLLQPLVATVGSMISAIRTDAARLAAEDRERGQEQLYRAVIEYAAEAVVAFRDNGSIEAANPAAARMTGYDESEMVGRSITEFMPVDDAGDYLALGKRALEQGTTVELEVRDRHGNLIPVELSFGRTEYGTEPITTAIVRNIAERRAIEAALRDAKEAAERTSRAKDDFLAGMSHELRTPLNAVIGLSSILGREVYGPVNAKQREYVEQIEASGRHLLALINDILDLAKIEAHRLDAALEPVALGPLVASAVAVVQETALSKGLRIGNDVADDLPFVSADPLRTKQILINLLANAVKFTEPGGEVGIEGGVVDDRVLIAVRDTGIGIPADRIHDIFAPFEQLDSSLARAHEGTGLGLALSRRLAELQGGELSVSSEVGVGSRFTLTLRVSSEAPAATSRRASDRDTQIDVGDEKRNLRVLVVEDNEVNRQMVADYLQAHGIEVEIAENGDEAVAKARSSPDVILMDVQLPGRDGLSATREIKADPSTSRIPVIALTALAMNGDAERCFEAGCDDYLAKPCDPADILSAVRALVTAKA